MGQFLQVIRDSMVSWKVIIKGTFLHFCSFRPSLFSSSSGSVQNWAVTNLLGVLPMKCNDCARQKKCRQKEKPPANCERFLPYEDSAKFAAYDRMMRSNCEISFPANESFIKRKGGIPPFWKRTGKSCPKCGRHTMREDPETGGEACNHCGYDVNDGY